MRKYDYEYPDYTAELDKLNSFPKGSAEYVDELPRVLKRIIEKHRFNAEHTKALHNRYKVMDDAVPIFKRKPRFPNSVAPINHKVNNDFFGEIVDFFTGCFGGLKYAYSDTDESKRETGDIGRAAKCLSDFVTENTMRDKDNEVKKLASICGYVGRLMYHDRNGRERVAIIPAYQVAVLSEDELTSPLYGLRYYKTKKYDGKTEIVADPIVVVGKDEEMRGFDSFGQESHGAVVIVGQGNAE